MTKTPDKKSITHKIPERKNFFENNYSKLSKIIAPYFLNTSLTPNHVTIISGLFGVIGAILLLKEEYVFLLLSGVFIQIYAILDLVDGDLARAKKMQTNFGMWLDIFFDKLIDFLIVLCMSAGLYFRSSDPLLLFSGILLMGFIFFIQYIMVLNNTYFKVTRISNEVLINRSTLYKNNKYYKSLINMIMFYRNHLSLQHNTFLFLISLFAITDSLHFGIIFLIAHAVISLVLSVSINFIKLNKT